MSPATIAIIVEALLRHGPAFGKAVYELFRTDNPTPQQWGDLFSLAERSYESYVPASKLPPLP